MDSVNTAHADWLEERRAAGRDVMQSAQRTYAAMQGWNGVPTQEAWQQLQDQTAEDWENGAQLISMLGGARFIEPERAALCLMLWRQFVDEYQAKGPAEYMVIAMAVLSFDHWLRINSVIHNVQARLEYETFGRERLTTVDHPDPNQRVARGLTAEQLVAELGQDLLPLLDRLNRLVIRNLRALRELKGGPLALTVANYGQVNVGQVQTNLAQPNSEPTVIGKRRTRRAQPAS